MKTAIGIITAAGLALSACQSYAASASNFVQAPAAKVQAHESGGLKTAYFAGGCFWSAEAVFSHLKGVKSVVTGYDGGNAKTAHYDIVSSGQTAHVEAVKVVYDPSVIRYDQLLQVFFSVLADPTLRDRQGPDVGPQYNAEVLPGTPDQVKVAKAYLAQMKASGKWKGTIVTPVKAQRTFFPAEGYHQDFAAKHPNHPYIVQWDKPKIAMLARMYPQLYSASFQRG